MNIELDDLIFDDNCNIIHENIPVVDSSDVTYNNFFKNFIFKNRPCLITNVGINWESTNHWVCNNGKPNFEYLRKIYGNYSVMVYKCDERYFNSQKTEEMTVAEYLNYWENNTGSSLKYLKDWHLKNEAPEDLFYAVPEMFASDWLNEYLCENSLDDYRFVYMGPKGTWTPFHVDVFTSYSWSVNISGRKRWLLFPPEEEIYLCDILGNLPFNIKNVPSDRICFEVIQNASEAIFVPSNWHHQVWNLEDTISVNHNWINGCNIKTIWLSLLKTLKDVQNEIQDCIDMDNFDEHCQVILKSTFGFDFVGFYEFITYIAIKRIHCIEMNFPIKLSNGRFLGQKHALYDLKAIKDILELLLKNNYSFLVNSLKKCSCNPIILLDNINVLLNIQQ